MRSSAFHTNWPKLTFVAMIDKGEVRFFTSAMVVIFRHFSTFSHQLSSAVASCYSYFILFYFISLIFLCNVIFCYPFFAHYTTLWFKKNAPTLADYNYNPVQSILIIFSKLFVNDHKSCLVVKFSTSPHICCHCALWNTMLYFALITLLIARNAPTSDHHITSISVKEF